MSRFFFLCLSLLVTVSARCESKDTIRIAATHFEAFDYYASGDWFVAFTSDDGAYSVRLDYVSSSKCGVFSQKDLVADYSYIVIEESYRFVDFDEAEITVTEEETEGVRLTAIATGSDGNIYHITCEEKETSTLTTIRQPKPKCMKRFENGRMVIEARGCRYDALTGRMLR